ncbi:MAG TPA: ribosome-binding factor A [Rectinemataceae bacterium]|nr:ribosome-binding factor A [Rectinemataceae bacterium]
MDEIRQRKLEDQIREELSSLILAGEVKDPRVGPFVSLTRVEAARDLSFARVFVSSFAAALAMGRGGDEGTGATEAEAEKAKAALAAEDEALNLAVAGLNHAAGFMQSRIGKRLRTRLTPKLVFVADHGIREGFEMNERIKGLFP